MKQPLNKPLKQPSLKQPFMVYANDRGEVMNHPDYTAIGRTGAFLTEVQPVEWIPLPDGATLTWLPGTRAIGIDPENGDMTRLPDDAYAVGALLPQAFTRLYLPAYARRQEAPEAFPLFGYTAVGWWHGKFYVAADRTDNPEPWNPALVQEQDVEAAVAEILRDHPDNRLYEHLSHCALQYGCLTAKNTFLGRYEGALPISSTCNAGCVGCISEQPDDAPFPSPQTRLTFRPSAEELAEVMLNHIRSNPSGIVSFGQGCEGEPATRWLDIVKSIQLVRAETSKGYININTNAGLTKPLQAVVDAGLDLMRVSTISAIEEHYNAYYRPRGYTVQDVANTLRYAADKGVYTSINYLVFPGVTDREEEIEAMIDFLKATGVRLIQMRNLNIDPDYYLSRIPAQRGELYGLRATMEIFREEIPGIVVGSYSHVPDVHREVR